jgi:hypothetical protein
MTIRTSQEHDATKTCKVAKSQRPTAKIIKENKDEKEATRLQ